MSSGFDRGRATALACALFAWLGTTPAFADTDSQGDPAPPTASSEQDRDAARQLALEALDLMEGKRWQEAHVKLERAYALFDAPTVAVLSARALENIGQLVEAKDRYEKASLTAVDEDSPKPFKRAVREAKREADRLQREVPKLTVEVVGTQGEAVRVDIDGRSVDPARLGAPMGINPGEHTVSAHVGSQSVSQKITLARSETSRLALAVLTKESAAPPSTPAPKQAPRQQSVLPWLSMGVGGLGLVTGVVAGAIMLDAKSNLDNHCSSTCPEDQDSNLTKFRNARSISLIGYSVGFVGVGLGVALLVERSGQSSAPVVAVGNGVAAVGYWGRF